MNQFELALKNEKLLHYHRMAVLLLIVNFAAFIIVAIYATVNNTRYIAIAGVVTTMLGLAIAYWQYATVKSADDKRNVLGLYFAAICWALMQHWAPAVICLLIQLFYSLSVKKQLVTVNVTDVQYPGLFAPATARWDSLNNIVLKDGLLTIDFKNNKIIQAEIIETAKGVDGKAFNSFCQTQLNHHSAAV